MKRQGRWFSAVVGLAAALAAPAAGAQSEDAADAVAQAEAALRGLETQTRNASGAIVRRGPGFEERFADAELLYRLRDYARASVLFTDIVENYANTPAFPQGLFLLGDSLYLAGDYYGARTRFRQLMQHAGEPVFRPFVQRSLGRLLEIALRLNDYTGIDDIFSRIRQIPQGELEAETSYVRGKYLFLRDPPDYDGARQAFEEVGQRATMYPQARYFLGAILTAQQHYPEAIEAFQRVLQVQPEGSDQQQVLDLAALAIGRLQIERENYDAAVESYQRVGRTSPFFDRALFEQAWAHIKAGDAVRAERALEILSISSPDSPMIPEGRLLWGNLLLRTGRFDRAQQVFEEVRAQFGPVHQELQRLDRENLGSERYFREMVRSNTNVFDAAGFLPAPAVAWLRHDGTLESGMHVVSDLSLCQTYVREAQEIIDQLLAALEAPSRSHVFQDLGRARQTVFTLTNRVTVARDLLARAMDGQADAANVELQGVINQRRALAQTIQRLPTDDVAVRRRDRQVEQEYRAQSQALQRNQQRVETLDAMVAALERYLADPSHRGEAVDTTQIQQELDAQRANIARYRERISAVRRQIVQGQAQIGPGDPRFAHDAQVSAQVRDLVQREADLVRTAGRMPSGVDGMLGRLDAVDRRIAELDGVINGQVDTRVAALREQVREEEVRVAGFRERLAALENESAQVVGGLIRQRIRDVQVHFYQIVMRADLGLVDVSWEQREEHHNRERMLAEEMNREITALNDEFAEVTDGASPEDRAALGQRPAGGSGSGSSLGGGAPPTTPPATPSPSPTPAPTPPGAAPSTPPATTPAPPSGGAPPAPEDRR
ncbi:MAG: tetratricopeptide repeat protein [Deltaproteobacteria bacterium]|nr:tetratricopeptide repeat protein [Deltaproteobacteria bacterium]